MNRRNFLLGAGVTLVAAPAIVRVASIMPVKALPLAEADRQRQLWTLLSRKLAEIEAEMAAELGRYMWGGDPAKLDAFGKADLVMQYRYTPLDVGFSIEEVARAR